MLLNRITDLTRDRTPLSMVDRPRPVPQLGELLVRVVTCGVCHTELDEIEGRTAPPKLPVVPGHQVVGVVEDTGSGVGLFKPGDKVGIAWIFSACGKCEYCRQGLENLCPEFRATGRDADGGYAEYMTVNEKFAVAIPANISAADAAPLLCAGAIGYRSLRLTNLQAGQMLGLTGFGASAHLVLKMVHWQYPDSKVFVFARNPQERQFAQDLGAVWAGDTVERSPELLDAIIDTTPVWKPVVEALANLTPDGRLVINAIRKEQIDQDYLLQLDYPTHLWMEKEIKSVANVTRADVQEFLELAAAIPLQPEVEEYALADANRALVELKQGQIRGAKILRLTTEF